MHPGVFPQAADEAAAPRDGPITGLSNPSSPIFHGDVRSDDSTQQLPSNAPPQRRQAWLWHRGCPIYAQPDQTVVAFRHPRKRVCCVRCRRTSIASSFGNISASLRGVLKLPATTSRFDRLTVSRSAR